MAPVVSEAESPSHRRKIFAVCILLVVALGLFAVNINATTVYSKYSSQTKKRIDTLRRASLRQNSAETSSVKDNAVREYRAIAWVLEKPTERSMTAEQINKSQITDTFESGLNFNPQKLSAFLKAESQEFRARLNPELRSVKKRQVASESEESTAEEDLYKFQNNQMSTELQTQFEALLPLTEHIDRGLNSSVCLWNPRIESGFTGEVPHFQGSMLVVQMMRAKAREVKASESLLIAQSIIAFANDLAEHESLLAAMLAVSIRTIGYECIEEHLSRPELGAEDYQQLADFLASVSDFNARHILEIEELSSLSTALKLADNSSPEAVVEASQLRRDLSAPPIPSLFIRNWVNYEISVIQRQYQKLSELTELPIDKRRAAFKSVADEIESSWAVLAKISVPNASAMTLNIEEELARRRMIRILVAAQQYRLANKKLPNKIEELGEFFETEVPTDPLVVGNSSFHFHNADDRILVFSKGNLRIPFSTYDPKQPPRSGDGPFDMKELISEKDKNTTVQDADKEEKKD